MWRKGIKAKYSILLYTLYMKLQDMYDAEKQLLSREWAGGYFIFFFFFNKFIYLFIYLFIYFWLCWVSISVRGLSPVAASGGHSSSRYAGLSPSRPLSLRSTGSRRAGSVAVAHGPSCSAACGILPDQGPNPCPLHWQADSQPLRHQGSPAISFYGWQNQWCVVWRCSWPTCSTSAREKKCPVED